MQPLALREATLGVSDLRLRLDSLSSAGLAVISRGPVSLMASGRLFDTHLPPQAALVGSRDGAGLRVRLVELTPLQRTGSRSLREPGPLGVSFRTPDPDPFFECLTASGYRTSPVPRNGTERHEGPWLTRHGEDGDFALVEKATDRGAVSGGDAWLAVSNLDSCLHFMSDLLGHRHLTRAAAPAGMGSVSDATPDATVEVTAVGSGDLLEPRCVFAEFERRPGAMPQQPGLSPGLCRLRYDTASLDDTLARVPGAGGSLVRGPAAVDDAVLGAGLVALIRAPFGVVVELWQTR